MLRTFALAISLLLAAPLLAGSAFAQTERWARENWDTDFSKFVIELSDVVNVIPRDAIPSIDAPKFHSVSDETNIPGQEPVVAFALNGDARAYPIRYLMWHEIVNDVVGGKHLENVSSISARVKTRDRREVFNVKSEFFFDLADASLLGCFTTLDAPAGQRPKPLEWMGGALDQQELLTIKKGEADRVGFFHIKHMADCPNGVNVQI